MCRNLQNIKNGGSDKLILKFKDETIKQIPSGNSKQKLKFDVQEIHINAIGNQATQSGKKFSFKQGGKNIEAEDDGNNPKLSLEIDNKEKGSVNFDIVYIDEDTKNSGVYTTSCNINSITATLGAKTTKLKQNGTQWEGSPNTINIIAKELRENK